MNLEVNDTRICVGRIIYFTLAIVFTLCIIAQVFFAGMAIFLNTGAWMKHIMFVHLFGFNVPFLMFIFAVIGAMPRWAYWQLFGVLVSIFLMYFTANIKVILPWMGALHPVIGILLFVLSYSIVLKSWNLIMEHQKGKNEI